MCEAASHRVSAGLPGRSQAACRSGQARLGQGRVAGSGDDLLIYNFAQTVGATDIYQGNAGRDTSRFQLTLAEWLRTDVQADIARLITVLDSTGNSGIGNSGSRFFKFNSTGLTISDIEKLQVVVDGQVVDARDEAVQAVADQAAVNNNATVTIHVLANDSVPHLVKSVTLLIPVNAGALTLNPDGSFTFDPGSDFDYLGSGETAQVSFTYRVTDADADVARAAATITVTGTSTSGSALDGYIADALVFRDENRQLGSRGAHRC
jgi:VCBS repeat-containing protein